MHFLIVRSYTVHNCVIGRSEGTRMCLALSARLPLGLAVLAGDFLPLGIAGLTDNMGFLTWMSSV